MEYMESRMQDQIEGAQLAHEQAMQAGSESAFPVVWPDDKGVQFYGISVRDYFAAKAMAAMITTSGGPSLFGLDGCEPETAKAAYRIADAMLQVTRPDTGRPEQRMMLSSERAGRRRLGDQAHQSEGEAR